MDFYKLNTHFAATKTIHAKGNRVGTDLHFANHIWLQSLNLANRIKVKSVARGICSLDARQHVNSFPFQATMQSTKRHTWDRVSIYFPWRCESVCEWWLSPPLCILANKQLYYRYTGEFLLLTSNERDASTWYQTSLLCTIAVVLYKE